MTIYYNRTNPETSSGQLPAQGDYHAAMQLFRISLILCAPVVFVLFLVIHGGITQTIKKSRAPRNHHGCGGILGGVDYSESEPHVGG